MKYPDSTVLNRVFDDVNDAFKTISSSSKTYVLVKLDWASGNLDYVGKNTSVSASDDDTDWDVTKMYYDASSNLTETQTKTGAWSNRSGLF